jgi:cytidine deaminase
MAIRDINIPVQIFSTPSELLPEDATLLAKARAITSAAYAPYSNFLVGAAAVLKNGEILTGTNQENASYPVGICAERVLLGNAATLYPNVPIITMAISYQNLKGDSNKPISPCGMCRQVLSEYEIRVSNPIRLILSGQEGEIFVIEKASQLLPLTFTPNDLK